MNLKKGIAPVYMARPDTCKKMHTMASSIWGDSAIADPFYFGVSA